VVNDRTGRGTDQVYGPLIGSLSLSCFQRKNESVWVRYVDPLIGGSQRTVLTTQGSSLFSKERTCLDSVVKLSLFQRKMSS
jgi:hypothetical protein